MGVPKQMPTGEEALLSRIDELKHACLAAAGFIGGQSIADKESIKRTLCEAVKLDSEPYPSRRR